MSQYYVYALMDPRRPGNYQFNINNKVIEFPFQVYYIGKGKGNRYKQHFKETEENKRRNKIKLAKIKKIKKSGFNPSLYISLIFENLEESEAFRIENESILIIGRIDLKTGTLANLTDGGEGTSGFISSFRNKTYEEIHSPEKAK